MNLYNNKQITGSELRKVKKNVVIKQQNYNLYLSNAILKATFKNFDI